ncbi:hypothetical protein HanRHA438_Chr02g0080991 [Helianthus annuus]|nr:hypothetical protein HanRHA438_Chr02g0080991 [Helianthus annuus]
MISFEVHQHPSKAYPSSSSKDLNNPSMTHPSTQTYYNRVLTVWPSQTRRMVDLVKLNQTHILTNIRRKQD